MNQENQKHIDCARLHVELALRASAGPGSRDTRDALTELHLALAQDALRRSLGGAR